MIKKNCKRCLADYRTVIYGQRTIARCELGYPRKKITYLYLGMYIDEYVPAVVCPKPKTYEAMATCQSYNNAAQPVIAPDGLQSVLL
jgi:hypothetical protein